jgi:hypothetical protein
MPVTLLLPGALLPREVVQAMREPLAQSALSAMLARAELVGDSETEAPAHVAWLGERLFGDAAAPATAPYAYAALSGAPSAAFLWHADPVHLEPARDHLVVTALAVPPTVEESLAFLDSANDLAAEHGARFLRAADRWFMQTDRPWQLQPAPLAAAVGRPLQAARPVGADAARWSRLLTEIQMQWHTLAANEAREARGETTVNSVWLHGGGTWAPLPASGFTSVLADAPEWRGAAQAAALPAVPGDAEPRDGALVVWSELLAPRLMQDWDAWLAALHDLDRRVARLARDDTVDLVLGGEHVIRRLRTRPRDRLKFWRTRPLDHALSE